MEAFLWRTYRDHHGRLHERPNVVKHPEGEAAIAKEVGRGHEAQAPVCSNRHARAGAGRLREVDDGNDNAWRGAEVGQDPGGWEVEGGIFSGARDDDRVGEEHVAANRACTRVQM